MLVWIAGIITFVVLAVIILAATRPATFSITRRATVSASPEKVFALISDFHEWPKWSPWEDKDPAMQRKLSGADRGKGAVYEWSGDKNVGQGRMEIIKAEAAQRIDIDLRFITPWKAHNQTVFELTRAGQSTDVLWTMSGPSTFMFRLMGLFMNMEAMIGNDFEKGLARLKAASEI